MAVGHEFEIPDEFEEYLNQQEVRQREHVERKNRAQKRKQRTKRREETAHKKRASEELQYAEFIFKWARSFRESDIAQRLMTVRDSNLLRIFEWHPGWGYDLYLSPEAIRWYRFGPGSETHYCKTPEELAWWASGETPGMLEACCEAIESGEVWKWIQKDLNLHIELAEEDLEEDEL